MRNCLSRWESEINQNGLRNTDRAVRQVTACSLNSLLHFALYLYRHNKIISCNHNNFIFLLFSLLEPLPLQFHLSKTPLIEMPAAIIKNGDVDAVELWRPSAPEKTAMFKFQTHISQKYSIKLKNYDDLWQWSVSNPAEFWEEVWHQTGVKAHKPYSKVRVHFQS